MRAVAVLIGGVWQPTVGEECVHPTGNIWVHVIAFANYKR